jgi:hypothetical protein
LRGKRWIKDRSLTARIDQEIKRACVVDGYGNDDECSLNKPRGHGSDVSRASRRGPDDGNDQRRETDSDEPMMVANTAFHIFPPPRGGREVEETLMAGKPYLHR